MNDMVKDGHDYLASHPMHCSCKKCEDKFQHATQMAFYDDLLQRGIINGTIGHQRGVFVTFWMMWTSTLEHPYHCTCQECIEEEDY